MKKLLIMALFLSSCNQWDGEINGIKYRVEQRCISGHDETVVLPVTTIGANNQLTTTLMPQGVWHCDLYVIDTVWENKLNK